MKSLYDVVNEQQHFTKNILLESDMLDLTSIYEDLVKIPGLEIVNLENGENGWRETGVSKGDRNASHWDRDHSRYKQINSICFMLNDKSFEISENGALYRATGDTAYNWDKKDILLGPGKHTTKEYLDVITKGKKDNNLKVSYLAKKISDKYSALISVNGITTKIDHVIDYISKGYPEGITLEELEEVEKELAVLKSSAFKIAKLLKIDPRKFYEKF